MSFFPPRAPVVKIKLLQAEDKAWTQHLREPNKAPTLIINDSAFDKQTQLKRITFNLFLFNYFIFNDFLLVSANTVYLALLQS